jgi:hypothetical protein
LPELHAAYETFAAAFKKRVEEGALAEAPHRLDRRAMPATTPAAVHAAGRPPEEPPDTAPGPDGQAGRHLIRSREFKAATDEDGSHESGSLERGTPSERPRSADERAWRPGRS